MRIFLNLDDFVEFIQQISWSRNMTLSLRRKFMTVTLYIWKVKNKEMKLLCGLNPKNYNNKNIENGLYDNKFTDERMKIILDIDEHLRCIEKGVFRRDWLYHNTDASGRAYMSGLTSLDQAEFDQAAEAVLRLRGDQIAAGAYWCVEPRINRPARALREKIQRDSARLEEKLLATIPQMSNDDQDGADD